MSKKIITSSTNQTVKDLVRLKDRKGVWAEGSFLVEGRRELERAINCGFELQDFLYCPEFKSDQWMPETAASSETTLSKEAFNKIATRDANDGVIGVFKQKTWKLSDLSALKKGKDAFVVAVEDVEKPGNLGAILRTADAAGVDAVIALNHTVDSWNPNVIRASLGGVFSVPVIFAANEDFHSWCLQTNVKTVAAALSAQSKNFYDASLQGGIAFILGTEAHGLSRFWLERANELVKIPMNGVCDSLNVSVAAAVCIYEAVRQRCV